MKLIKITAVIGMLLGSQGVQAGGEAKITPLRSSVVVTEVTGKTEYAYDSTGWKTLQKGKVLQPGATVRAGEKSAAILKSMHAPTLIKVSSGTKLHLTLEAPIEEGGALQLADSKILSITSIAHNTQRAPDSGF